MPEMLLIAAAIVFAMTVGGASSSQSADVAQGEQVFKKCERCHTLNPGGASGGTQSARHVRAQGWNGSRLDLFGGDEKLERRLDARDA